MAAMGEATKCSRSCRSSARSWPGARPGRPGIEILARLSSQTRVCLFVAPLLSNAPIDGDKRTGARAWCGRIRELFDEVWLQTHWWLMEHSTRAALAVALLPLA
jgi:hypothetical protein